MILLSQTLYLFLQVALCNQATVVLRPECDMLRPDKDLQTMLHSSGSYCF